MKVFKVQMTLNFDFSIATEEGREGNLIGDPLNKSRIPKGYILTVEVTRVKLVHVLDLCVKEGNIDINKDFPSQTSVLSGGKVGSPS